MMSSLVESGENLYTNHQNLYSEHKNNQGEGIIFKASIIFKVRDSKKSFIFSMLKSSILMPDSNPA